MDWSILGYQSAAAAAEMAEFMKGVGQTPHPVRKKTVVKASINPQLVIADYDPKTGVLGTIHSRRIKRKVQGLSQRDVFLLQCVSYFLDKVPNLHRTVALPQTIYSLEWIHIGLCFNALIKEFNANKPESQHLAVLDREALKKRYISIQTNADPVLVAQIVLGEQLKTFPQKIHVHTEMKAKAPVVAEPPVVESKESKDEKRPVSDETSDVIAAGDDEEKEATPPTSEASEEDDSSTRVSKRARMDVEGEKPHAGTGVGGEESGSAAIHQDAQAKTAKKAAPTKRISFLNLWMTYQSLFVTTVENFERLKPGAIIEWKKIILPQFKQAVLDDAKKKNTPLEPKTSTLLNSLKAGDLRNEWAKVKKAKWEEESRALLPKTVAKVKLTMALGKKKRFPWKKYSHILVRLVNDYQKDGPKNVILWAKILPSFKLAVRAVTANPQTIALLDDLTRANCSAHWKGISAENKKTQTKPAAEIGVGAGGGGGGGAAEEATGRGAGASNITPVKKKVPPNLFWKNHGPLLEQIIDAYQQDKSHRCIIWDHILKEFKNAIIANAKAQNIILDGSTLLYINNLTKTTISSQWKNVIKPNKAVAEVKE